MVSDPPGSVVLVDGVKYKSPCDLQLKPGAHEVKVAQQGYKTHQERVVLDAGQKFKLMARLESVSGGVSLSTQPKGANVFLEGKPRGVTPLELKGLPPQRFSSKVVKEGYKPYVGAVEVVAGKTRNVAVNLEKIPPPPPPPEPVYYPPPPPVYLWRGDSGRSIIRRRRRGITRRRLLTTRRLRLTIRLRLRRRWRSGEPNVPVRVRVRMPGF